MNVRKILDATAFAIEAHDGQKRKGSDGPYVSHPIAVSMMVADRGGDEAQIIAALLHDVVEDTAVTLTTIRSLFGEDVANLVDEMTDKNPPSEGTNRAERKAREIERWKTCSDRAKMIKRADIEHNEIGIELLEPGFVKLYREEKRELMKVLV